MLCHMVSACADPAAGRYPASDPRRPYMILLFCRVDCVFPLPAGQSLADMAASIIGGGSEGHSGSALYHLASLFNHSCMPNLDVQFLENKSRFARAQFARQLCGSTLSHSSDQRTYEHHIYITDTIFALHCRVSMRAARDIERCVRRSDAQHVL